MVTQFQDAVNRVMVEDSLIDYMLAIVDRTRNHESLALGVSPRGSQALFRAVQALALLEGRDYAIPDDVKRLAAPLFAHRVVINTRATLVQRRADMGERIIEEILSQVEVPL
jgi:MoxR-like ATPase